MSGAKKDKPVKSDLVESNLKKLKKDKKDKNLMKFMHLSVNRL